MRRYDIVPGKQAALVDRFGTFTVPHWQQRGFRVVGFWTPELGAYSNHLIYMLGWESFEERVQKFSAWQADPERAKKWEETEANGPLVKRVANALLEPTSFSHLDLGVAYGPDASTRSPYLFELREYEATAGNRNALVNRFGKITQNYFKQYGFRQVGYWTPVMGGHNQQLIYMLAWESYEERNQKFTAFRADSGREHAFAETETNGPLVERTITAMLRPTAFSPMK